MGSEQPEALTSLLMPFTASTEPVMHLSGLDWVGKKHL